MGQMNKNKFIGFLLCGIGFVFNVISIILLMFPFLQLTTNYLFSSIGLLLFLIGSCFIIAGLVWLIKSNNEKR